MQDVVSLDAPVKRGRLRWLALARTSAPSLVECALAALSSTLLILSFPDFNLWPLAWVGLVPLFVALARRPRAPQAFLLGWLTGTLFFYGSCWWLTHSMIHYGGIPTPLAYLLLAPITILVGLFPALACLALARLCARWGACALMCAPLLWSAQDWARLNVTGQLWNAIGYSQAFHPTIIQAARWGGVYAIGFLLALVNATAAYALLTRSVRALATLLITVACVALLVLLSAWSSPVPMRGAPSAVVVGIQPDVSVNFGRSMEEMDALVSRHLWMSETALKNWETESLRRSSVPLDQIAQTQTTNESSLRTLPRVVVWPESPMNFTYAQDAQFRQLVGNFARTQRTSVIFNSLEPAPGGGAYNSAVMVNEEGRLVAQYDKIRLLPFGEYVPLPRWLPGSGLASAIVGDFMPGTEYPLMPVGNARAGVFICFESAFPAIARRFTQDGADVLLNISNDGYLGRTPVLRQHLANAVFRAVENGRPVLRVTNTGISAFITPRGDVTDATDSFEPESRTWTVARANDGQTFYTRHGDIFVALCAILSLLLIAGTWLGRRTIEANY